MSVIVTVSPPIVRKIGSSINSSISNEHRELVFDALKRMEILYDFPVSRWERNFLSIRSENYRLTFEIKDVNQTTLKTERNIDKFLELLEVETQKLIQDKIYSDIISKAESKGLELRKETIEDEETIVLTYRIP